MLQTGWLRVTTTHVPYSYRHYNYSMLFLFYNFFQFFIILMYVTTIIMKSFELNVPT